MGPYKIGEILMVRVSTHDIEYTRAVCVEELTDFSYIVYMVVRSVGLGRVFVSRRYLEPFQVDTATQPTVVDLMSIIEDLGRTSDTNSDVMAAVIRKAIEENYLNEKE